MGGFRDFFLLLQPNLLFPQKGVVSEDLGRTTDQGQSRMLYKGLTDPLSKGSGGTGDLSTTTSSALPTRSTVVSLRRLHPRRRLPPRSTGFTVLTWVGVSRDRPVVLSPILSSSWSDPFFPRPKFIPEFSRGPPTGNPTSAPNLYLLPLPLPSPKLYSFQQVPSSPEGFSFRTIGLVPQFPPSPYTGNPVQEPGK